MWDLAEFLEQCGSVGIVVRHPEFALSALVGADLSEPEKVLQVFEQGRSLGTHIYVDNASFSLIDFHALLGGFNTSGEIARRIELNLCREAPEGLCKQEQF